MNFTTKIAIVVAEDLAVWQKLNVVAFLMSGIIAATDEITGESYVDASGESYRPLCIQPTMILKSSRDKLTTYLRRAKERNVPASIYIEDMFTTGHDAANRETVKQYKTELLPLVGIGIRSDKKEVDKIFKGAKLHD